MAFKYPDCASCYFHDREPTICDECDEGDNWEPDEFEEEPEEKLAKKKVVVKPLRFVKPLLVLGGTCARVEMNPALQTECISKINVE